jgi:transposase
MSDDELAGLNPRQVVALVRQLEARLQAVETELAAAQARNAGLEAELGRRGGAPKTPRNFSTPPSKGWERERSADEGAKRGPPFGHLGTSRRRLGRRVPAGALWGLRANIGGRPAGASGREPGRGAAARAAGGARSVALCCHLRPLWGDDHGGLSGRVRADAGVRPAPRSAGTYRHEQHQVRSARLAALGRDLWQWGISQGALANALRRAAGRRHPQAVMIREPVRASPTIGSDETSARVNGRTHWQWVFQTPTASYHVIEPRRNGDVVRGGQSHLRAHGNRAARQGEKRANEHGSQRQ